MNKFELKEKLTKLSDCMESAVGEIMSPQADTDTAAIRSRVYTALMDAYDVIRKEIYGIH